MSHQTKTTATSPAHTIASPGKIRSITRRFGREASRHRPASTETDAKLRAAHVRAAGFRAELY